MRQWNRSLISFLTALCLGSISVCQAQEKKEEKIDPPNWKTLSAAYDYNNSQPPTVKQEEKKADNSYLLHITMTGVKGDIVPGLFAHPKKEGVYPVVLLMHGLGSSKEEMLQHFGIPLLAKGYAVLALDAPHHGERIIPNDNPKAPDAFGEAVHDGCVDYRRALDWLATRKDVDMKRIGLIGYSMGAIEGTILGGVEERISAFALCVGGDPIIAFIPQVPDANRTQIFTICPSLYVDHIAPRPIIMLNARQDKTVVESASKRLYDAAKEPKEQVWYDSGHILPPSALDKCIAWIGDKLKNEKSNTQENKAVTKTDKQ
jgi:fermentation-respiration switch protein FrsA (DUF1100 family)